ncbi:hypothetical protein RJ641_012972 [Dillenia turbinata]|uniref:Uncharacterized protein n=1 Tax=Dillenia turbinata TaxID=194707 RepID=A0AAN8UUY0_9MAGN
MTMVNPSAHQQQQQHQHQQKHKSIGFGEGFGRLMVELGGGGYEYDGYRSCSSLGASSFSFPFSCDRLLMAEDESTTHTNTNCATNEDAGAGGGGSGSKEVAQEGGDHRDREEAGWLQLGIAVGTTTSSTSTSERKGGALVELDLLTATSNPSYSSTQQQQEEEARPILAADAMFGHHHMMMRPPVPVGVVSSLNLQQQQQHLSTTSSPSNFRVQPHPHQQQVNWVLRPSLRSQTTATTALSRSFSSSSSFIMPPPVVGPYFLRSPFQGGGGEVVGPSSDLRIIDAPPRPHSGVWFVLQASQNQAKEPFLPQIPKSYLRIKDGRTTVRLLMKYLVNKLRLDSESEQVEITCRGQQLLPFLTLQHVRDNIWTPPRDELTLLPRSSTTDHVMVLHYGRIA